MAFENVPESTSEILQMLSGEPCVKPALTEEQPVPEAQEELMCEQKLDHQLDYQNVLNLSLTDTAEHKNKKQ